jgi:transcriptional regulator with XRE-family HTH domain
VRSLDPLRDDPGARLRKLRLQRGIPIQTLAELSGVSASFLSMVENGQRQLQRISDIVALSDALRTSPLYLAYGMQDAPGPRPGATQPVPFPALPDVATVRRHERLAVQFADLLARGDGRAAGNWLRRLARESAVNPWLLIDQLANSASTQRPDVTHPGKIGHRPTPPGGEKM